MKEWMKPTKLEWISFVAMMPVLAVVLNQLLFPTKNFSDRELWLFSFPIIMMMGLLSWYLHILVMHWLRIKYPSIQQTGKRLTILAIAHVLLTWTTFISLLVAYDLTHFLGYSLHWKNIQTALFIAVALTLVATSMWEADYTFKEWKNSLAEKEKLEQLTIQHEFETLKSQVNPHFLFNCFNTLSSLIGVFMDQARKGI